MAIMIIVYHNIFPDSEIPEYWWAGLALNLTTFKRHIMWLAQRYSIVSLADYLADDQKDWFFRGKPIVITFDDGLRLTFQCVFDFLEENNIPATFFVPTNHLDHGEILWFSYLDALCSEQLYKKVKVNQFFYPLQTVTQCQQARKALDVLARTSGNPVEFSRRLAGKYPISEEKIVKYEGMTYKQLIDAGKSNMLEIGAHTRTHLFLDQFPKETQMQEILESKRILEELTGKQVRYFAYPGGEYNADTLDVITDAGFDAALALIPKRISQDPTLELGRIGIYSRSLMKVWMKAIGVADIARRLGLRVG